MVTTHVIYSHYTGVVLYSECNHENNQSTHVCMNHTKAQKLLRPKDFGGRIFTTTNTTTGVQAKKKCLTHSHGPKTPLVA